MWNHLAFGQYFSANFFRLNAKLTIYRILGTTTLAVLSATALKAQRLPLPPRVKGAALALGKLNI